jgi:hypothetical protein
VSGNRIFAGEAFEVNGEPRAGLASFPLDCPADHGICRPVWFDPVGPISPTVSDNRWWLGTPTAFTDPIVLRGVVHIGGWVDGGSAHPGETFGPLYAFGAHCSERPGCSPLWQTESLSGVGTPTVRGSSVFVPSTSGLYVFSEGCRSDGGTCTDLWHAPTNIAGNISNFMSQPVVSGGYAFVTTTGDSGGGDSEPASVFAFRRDCRTDGGTCPPAWWERIHPLSRWTSPPSVHGGEVHVSGTNGLIEYPTSCQPTGQVCRDHATLGDVRSAYLPFLVTTPRGHRDIAVTAREGAWRPNGFDVFGVTCERVRCDPIASWRPSFKLQRFLAVGGREAFFGIEDGVIAVSVPDAKHPAAHVVWRWSAPVREVQRVVPAGCTTYMITNSSIYSVRRC